MNFKLKINGKMLVYVLGTALVIYLSTLGYISLKLRSVSAINAKETFESSAFKNAHKIQTQLNLYVESADITAQSLSHFNTIKPENRRSLFKSMIKDVIQKNIKINSISSIWEPNVLDGNDKNHINLSGNTEIGSFATAFTRNGENIIELKISSEALKTDSYGKAKSTLNGIVNETTLDNEKNTVEASYIAPIISNGDFCGIVSLQLPIARLQDSVQRMADRLNVEIMLISENNIILASTLNDQVNKSFEAYDENLNAQFQENIAELNNHVLTINSKHPIHRTNNYFAFETVKLGETDQNWYICLSTPTKMIYNKANKTFWLSLSIGLIGLVILSLIILAISHSITNPLSRTTSLLQRLVKGEIDTKGSEKNIIKDEISDMTKSMNHLIDGLSSASEFASQIGNGNLDVEYTLLSDNDTLGNALISMQESLKKAKIDEDIKRIEDEKRNWVTHGLAKFGEIIRQENNDIKKFTENVIRNLLEYIDAAQGAMYIQAKDDFGEAEADTYELQAAMAYGKLVMLNHKVQKGQELIGRAAEENRTIYLENLPEEYADLTPGIKSKEKPRHILVTPIGINNTIFGIFELLSYHPFESHHIEFIEKLSENVASVISSVNINISTAKLLEQSRHQADELAQHEEEMRQNLEEMQATQEEAVKRQSSLSSHIGAIKGNLITAELDLKGRILAMSSSMSVHYNVNIDNIKGKFYEAIITSDEKSRNEFNEFWVEMIGAEGGKRIQIINYRNKDHYYIETYHAVQKEGVMQKVIVVAEDKSKEKEMSDLLKQRLNEMD